MTNKITPSHDPFARKFLTDIEVAKDFLTIHLAPEVLEKCDLNTLNIESTSYIEDDLKLHNSDVVYRVELKGHGGYAYIYTLVEHQSTPDKLMPFRIIRYQIAIIQNHVEKYGEKLPLPMVVPLVFYNGVRSPYPYSSNITDLFDDKVLYDSAKLGTFKLIDLTTMETNEIFKHGRVAVLEMLQKAVRVRDFKAVIETIIEVLLLGKTNGLKQSLVDRGILYLFGARDVEEIKPLIEKIKQQIPDYGEEIMNFIDAMKLEGEQTGEQKAKQEIVQEMIKAGADESFITKVTHLNQKELDKIKKSMQ